MIESPYGQHTTAMAPYPGPDHMHPYTWGRGLSVSPALWIPSHSFLALTTPSAVLGPPQDASQGAAVPQ